MLKGKKCPRAGLAVVSRGLLVGKTTGECEGRRIEVAVPGLGVNTYKRSELTKLGKRETTRYEEELGAFEVSAPAPRHEPFSPAWAQYINEVE